MFVCLHLNYGKPSPTTQCCNAVYWMGFSRLPQWRNWRNNRSAMENLRSGIENSEFVENRERCSWKQGGDRRALKMCARMPLAQVTVIDRNVLRLEYMSYRRQLYEVPKVAINEAIEFIKLRRRKQCCSNGVLVLFIAKCKELMKDDTSKNTRSLKIWEKEKKRKKQIKRILWAQMTNSSNWCQNLNLKLTFEIWI